METKRFLVLAAMVFLVLTSAGLVFAQEQAEVQPEAPQVQPEAPQVQNETEAIWVLGEVVSIDPQKSEILVKYLDYESDQEKQIVVSADDKTTYEGIKSLGELKPQDTISIDYALDSNARNVAKNIAIEKPDEEKPAAEETVPGMLPEEMGLIQEPPKAE